MITIEKKVFAEIPCLVMRDLSIVDKDVPVTFLYHGWTQSKERMLVIGYEIVNKGFNVIIPDAYIHGERLIDNKDNSLLFLDILIHTTDEFNQLVESVHSEGEMTGKISVSGWSMGGIITSMILAKYNWVQSGAIMMGCPKLYDLVTYLVSSNSLEEQYSDLLVSSEFKSMIASYDLSSNLELLDNRNLYFWHAKNDSVVPSRFSKNYIEQMQAAGLADSIEYHFVENQGHLVPYDIIEEVADFFENTIQKD